MAYAQQTGDLTGLYSLLDTRRPEDVAAEIEEARATANSAVIEGEPLPSVVAEPAPAPAAPAPASTYIMPLEGRVTSDMGARQAPLRGASTDPFVEFVQTDEVLPPKGDPWVKRLAITAGACLLLVLVLLGAFKLSLNKGVNQVRAVVAGRAA